MLNHHRLLTMVVCLNRVNHKLYQKIYSKIILKCLIDVISGVQNFTQKKKRLQWHFRIEIE